MRFRTLWDLRMYHISKEFSKKKPAYQQQNFAKTSFNPSLTSLGIASGDFIHCNFAWNFNRSYNEQVTAITDMQLHSAGYHGHHTRVRYPTGSNLRSLPHLDMGTYFHRNTFLRIHRMASVSSFQMEKLVGRVMETEKSCHPMADALRDIHSHYSSHSYRCMDWITSSFQNRSHSWKTRVHLCDSFHLSPPTQNKLLPQDSQKQEIIRQLWWS